MRREEIRAFIKAGVDALSPSIKFNSGRITEFNSQRSNEYPYTWLESLSITGVTWNIIIHVAKKDKPDSIADQYEKIVDECDYIAQQLLSQYKIQLTGYNQLELLNDGREPFIHKHADDTSGVILSFEINDYSPTNVC